GCLADEPVPAGVADELRGLSERLAVVPVGRFARWVRAGLSVMTGRSLSEGAFAEPALRRVVRDWAGRTRFAAAVVSASSLAPYLRLKPLADTPKVVDLVDVDSQKWLDFAAATRGPRRWLYRLKAARVRKLECGLPRWTQALSLVSRAEADVFESYAGRGTVSVATNGVDLEYFAPVGGPTEQACAFVGAMDYLPNVDGVIWFAREVWPLIRADFPAAEFRIIGRKPTPAVQALAALPGVTLIGQVPDVRPHVASAAVAVVPLRLARGIQNKVLEALAMGKPVVAAPPALVALAAVPGEHLLAATTPAEWVEALGKLFSDPRRCQELGAAGRRLVEEHYHWDRCLEPLLEKIFAPAVVPA
ncbi:MAG TPA: TIGR03087 family PEP-CTERM/XrtA system glycosyltransferase, partial [Gemmataceae bacterium]|nr:TIGR03087 family PEP-CTERM/XrtA system glycosyltransferase [Gemmataceae bacterium]